MITIKLVIFSSCILSISTNLHYRLVYASMLLWRTSISTTFLFHCTNQVTLINQIYLFYIAMYFKLIHITFHYIRVYKYLPSTFFSNQISISYWKRKKKQQAIKRKYTRNWLPVTKKADVVGCRRYRISLMMYTSLSPITI